VDDEIASMVHISGSLLQRYRTGRIPDQKLVQIFAEQCVQRGFMGKAWLERFLRAAEYSCCGLWPFCDAFGSIPGRNR
jgi:hypothetical protein